MVKNKKLFIHPQINGFKNMGQQADSSAKKLIDTLSLKLQNSEQSENAYIIALNEFRSANPEKVLYNTKNGSYIVDNFYVVPGYIKKGTEFFDNIKFLNRMGFCRTSSPELVNEHIIPNKDFGVIVYKINDTTGGMLKSYIEMAKEVPIENKYKFFDEQVNLLKNSSKYNPAVILQDTWGVTPDTKNIYVDNWAKLENLPTKEQQTNFIEQLKDLLR